MEMIPYEKAKSLVFGSGSIPDGYFGDRVEVDFFMVKNRICILHESGYFASHFPDCLDIEEAKWIIKNHPSGRKYVKNFKEVK